MKPPSEKAADLNVPPGWEEAAATLASKPGTCLVIGAMDCGKSSFCLYLVRRLCRSRKRTALVDCDVGQSTLGPPTAIGLKLFKSAPATLDDIHPPFMAFVGSTSPEGHLLQALAGCKRMVERAAALSADVTVVDTTGFVAGPAARALKLQKAQLLAPNAVIGIQRGHEIEHLLTALEAQGASVIRLKSSPSARSRSIEERKRNREQRFHGYFANAKPVTLPFAQTPIGEFGPGMGVRLDDGTVRVLSAALGATVQYAERRGGELFLIVAGSVSETAPARLKADVKADALIIASATDYENAVVALNDAQMNVLGLGVIRAFHPADGKAEVWAPGDVGKQTRSLTLGAARILPSGEELPKGARFRFV